MSRPEGAFPPEGEAGVAEFGGVGVDLDCKGSRGNSPFVVLNWIRRFSFGRWRWSSSKTSTIATVQGESPEAFTFLRLLMVLDIVLGDRGGSFSSLLQPAWHVMLEESLRGSKWQAVIVLRQQGQHQLAAG